MGRSYFQDRSVLAWYQSQEKSISLGGGAFQAFEPYLMKLSWRRFMLRWRRYIFPWGVWLSSFWDGCKQILPEMRKTTYFHQYRKKRKSNGRSIFGQLFVCDLYFDWAQTFRKAYGLSAALHRLNAFYQSGEQCHTFYDLIYRMISRMEGNHAYK